MIDYLAAKDQRAIQQMIEELNEAQIVGGALGIPVKLVEGMPENTIMIVSRGENGESEIAIYRLD